MIEEHKYKVRPGTNDFGREYEDLSAAAYSIKLFNHEEVEDFYISFDNADYGNFDDIVVEIKFRDAPELIHYGIQLKHRINKYNLSTSSLIASSGDYGLDKYFASFNSFDQDIRNNSVFILSTNASLDLNQKVLRVNDAYRITINRHGLCEGQCCTRARNFFDTSTENVDSIYKFSAELHNDQEPCEEQKEYQKFFDRFYLYTSQRNVDGVKHYMTELLKSIYDCQDGDLLNNVCKTYVEFFRELKTDKAGYRCKLTKERINMKMTEILLTPHIQNICFDHIDHRTELLKNAILQFPVTVVKDGPGVVECVTKIWNSSDIADASYAREVAKHYGLNAKYTNERELTTQQRTKVSWLLKHVPLIIKVNASQENWINRTIALNLALNTRYILIVDNVPNETIPEPAFQTLKDIKTTDVYEEIVQNFTCCVQGRPNVSLKNMTDDDMDKVIQAGDLFNFLNNALVIGEGPAKFPEPFINRYVKKTLFDFNVLTLQEDLFIIATSFDSTTTVEDYLPSDKPSHDRLILNSAVFSEQDFDSIASEHPQRNVHHLNHIQEGTFEWICSSGPVAKLKRFQKVSDDHVVSDSELFVHFRNKTNVILMDPGMGKSVAMDYLQYTCPAHLWPVKINLGYLKDFFATGRRSVAAILKRVLKEPKDDLTGRVRKAFEKRNAVVFLWDGLDELEKSEWIDCAIDGIAELSRLGYRQWIAGRNHLKKKLEDKLNLFALSLNVFGKDEQKVFMQQRLSETYGDSVDYVVDQLMNSAGVTDEYPEVLQTPLLLLELTEKVKSIADTDKDNLNDKLEQSFTLANIMKDYRNEKDKYLNETRERDYKNSIAAREDDKKTKAIISNAM